MAEYVNTVLGAPRYIFSFSQREVDILISLLFDFTRYSAGALIDLPGDGLYEPNVRTLADMEDILSALNDVGMSADNDYLLNFNKVERYNV